MAYGPVAASDVPGLFAAGFLRGEAHALGHGPTEAIPTSRARSGSPSRASGSAIR
ncbi:MAG: hypothetical protein WKG00_38045 [Polyangiaceae bacterium]